MDNIGIGLVELYRAADTIEAHAIRIALGDEGIYSEIDGEDLQGSEYPIGWSTAPRILVAESQVAPAREVIVRAQAHRHTDGDVDSIPDVLHCLSCGRTMEWTEMCHDCGWTYKVEADS